MALMVLKAIDFDPKEEKLIENITLQFFYYTLLQPIIENNQLSKGTLNNSGVDIIKLIKSGRIAFEGGKFIGSFNASISKTLQQLGATFLPKSKVFKIELNQLPSSIQLAILEYQALQRQNFQLTLETINKINTQSIERLDFTNQYKDIINDLDLKITQQANQFAILPKLTAQMKSNIAKAYSDNLKLCIKNFADEEVIKLRQQVEKNLFAGFRRENLIQIIQESYNASKNKAKFLAKQETNLLMSEFTKERYKDAGVQKFQWTPSNSKIPDPYHKSLYGKVFSFDDLPIIDEKTRQRGLPKQRYGCSCGMRAVIEVHKINHYLQS